VGKWRFAVLFVLGLFLLSSISSLFFTSSEPLTGNVLLIPLHGPIFAEQTTDGLFAIEEISSSYIVKKLQQAEDDPSIDAVVFEINSPGGGAVASQEIVQAVKHFNKPTVSVIRTMGASGAYWIASATDVIYVNPLSLVGSIGVTSSYVEFAEFLEEYNITYQRIVSGKYKDMGSPLRALEDEEKDLLTRQITVVHDYFVNDVALNRDLSKDAVQELATGQVFLGTEAVVLGLVDEIGTVDSAKMYLENRLNSSVQFREISRRKSFSELLGVEAFAFNLGRGLGSWMTQQNKNMDSTLSMNYYD
jgi:protease-4